MHKSLEFLKKENKESKNKVIFLDIDGVIQGYNDQKRFDHDMDATVNMLAKKYNDNNYLDMYVYDVCAAYYDWNNIAIGIIKQLLEETNSNIVLSSDWRQSITIEQMKSLFKLYDLDEYLIDYCNPNPIISKEEAIAEYISNHKLDKYAIIDDKNFYTEFGEKFRNTSNLINLDDFYYLRMILKYDLSVNEDDKYINMPDLFTLKYDIDIIDNKKIMYLEKHNCRTLEPRYFLEYLFSYMILRKDIDLYVFNPIDFNIRDLTVNGYKTGSQVYYIFKDRYQSYELDDVIDKIKVKKI